MTLLRAALLLMLSALPLRAELAITEVVSPGGIRAWLVEDHAIPFTALEIRFRGGTSLDAPGRRGAVNLMAALLEEGTGDLDAQGFAAARDGLAAEMRFEAGRDAVAVSARFLTENRDAAADLLRRALAAPAFAPEAIERVRGQVLSNIAASDQDPGALASRALDAMAWGDHPYATPGEGTAASVAALTRDDLVAAHAAAIARDRVFVAAAGDITAADLGALLDRLLADLPATGAPQPPPAVWQASGGVTVVEFPVPQSVVLFAQPGIAREDPDFFAAYILNEILGGGRFGTRLMRELRETRGLTYGVSTWIADFQLGTSWAGQFSSDNARVAEAMALVSAEWRRAAAEGVSEQELAAAKTYLTGSYPLRFEGNGPIARILVGMQTEGMGIDYPVTRNARIEAVTAADVARVARRLLDADALRFVVAGRPEGLAAGQ